MAQRHHRDDDDYEDDDRPPQRSRNKRQRDDNVYEDDDDDYRPKRKSGNTRVPCPNCGGRSVRPGPWPWYLGTVGALMCRAVICEDCGHEYDEKKPQANLATRKRNLAIGINAVGLLGIITVIGLLILWISLTTH